VGQEVPPIAPRDDLTPESPDASLSTAPAGDEAAPHEGQDSQAAVLRNTAVMSVGTSLSRLTGFVRIAAMTYALGIAGSRMADTFNVANTTPNIIYELALGGVLSSVFVPVFVEWMQARGRDAAWDVSRRVMTLTVVVLSGIAALGVVFAPAIIRLYTVGGANGTVAEARAQALGTFFLRWFAPQIVFYGIGAVAGGLLNAHRRFAPPMFAPILNNIIATATFLAVALLPGPHPPSPDHITAAQRLVLAVGTTAGVAGMSLVLIPALRGLGWRWRWNLRWRHEAVLRIAHLAKWTVLYVAANQIGLLIVIVIAYGLRDGDYSAYVVAFVLFQLPHAIFAVSVFTAILPGMSSRFAARDLAGYRSLLSRGVRLNATIIVPAALGYIALAGPIVRLLFERGATGPAEARLIASVLVAFSLGMLPFSLFQLMLRAFYAMQDTRTPALINFAAVGANIVANLLFVLVLDLGVQGLALGYAVGYAVAAAASIVIVRRRTGRLETRRTLATVARVTAAAAVAAIAARLVADAIGRSLGTAAAPQQAVQVFGAVLVGMLVFGISALILRIEEVDTVRRTVTARFRR
jgi:putative peptidoglycan lipid II flippase